MKVETGTKVHISIMLNMVNVACYLTTLIDVYARGFTQRKNSGNGCTNRGTMDSSVTEMRKNLFIKVLRLRL